MVYHTGKSMEISNDEDPSEIIVKAEVKGEQTSSKSCYCVVA